MRVFLLIPVALINSCVLIEAGIFDLINGISPILNNLFLQNKWKNFHRATDTNGDGKLSLNDVKAVAQCVSIKAGLDVKTSNLKITEEIPLAWTAMHFDILGPAITSDLLLSFLGLTTETQDFVNGVEFMLTIGFDVLRGFTNNETISFYQLAAFHECMNINSAVTRELFKGMDTNRDNGIDVQELRAAGDDFFRGQKPDGIGALLFGPHD